MSAKGVWYSAAAGVYISLHDTGPTVEARIWAKTGRGQHQRPDISGTAAGKRSTVTARVLGGFRWNPVEVVAWGLTGPGSLALARDDDRRRRFRLDRLRRPARQRRQPRSTAEVTF